jgi:hypothetical protein
MTTTPPDDIAALFGLEPEPEASQVVESSTAAAEAALAAELAAELALTLESGGAASDAPDSRTDLRVKVSWPARMQLSNGHVIELEVRNVSEAGMGLKSDERIPADAVVDFEMGVPSLDAGGDVMCVKGTIRTTYMVVQGAEILCGGTWVQVPADGLVLVNRWIQRLQS